MDCMPGGPPSFYDLLWTRLTGFKPVDSKACFFPLKWSSPIPSSNVVLKKILEGNSRGGNPTSYIPECSVRKCSLTLSLLVICCGLGSHFHFCPLMSYTENITMLWACCPRNTFYPNYKSFMVWWPRLSTVLPQSTRTVTAPTSGPLAKLMDHFCRVDLGEGRLSTNLLSRTLPRKTLGEGWTRQFQSQSCLLQPNIVLGELLSFMIAFAYLWNRVLIIWSTL